MPDVSLGLRAEVRSGANGYFGVSNSDLGSSDCRTMLSKVRARPDREVEPER
jgi:hypothetical protein